MPFFQRVLSRVNYTDALADRKNKVLLEWSAKSGSALGVMMFFRHMGLLEEANRYSTWIHDYRIDIFYQRYGFATYRDLLDSGFIKLKIVRNPFDRSVSSYIQTMRFPNAEIRAIAGDQRPDMTFREFLHGLSTLDISHCNQHYQTQFRPYEAEGVVFDHILHLERLEEDVVKVNERSGLSLNFGGATNTHHVRKNGDSSPGALDMKWSALSGRVPCYSSFYDSETERLVSQLYEKDFVQYGYSMNSAERGVVNPSYKVADSQGAFARRLRAYP